MARVIITDDESYVREVLRTLLEGMGHDVEEATTGRELVERFDVDRHDLIFCDVMMPEMNGLQALTELAPLIRDTVPFIILSSYEDEEAIGSALFAGAFDYLLKSFEAETVRDTIRKAMEAREAWQRGENLGGPPPTESIPLTASPAPTPPPSSGGPSPLAREKKVVSVPGPGGGQPEEPETESRGFGKGLRNAFRLFRKS